MTRRQVAALFRVRHQVLRGPSAKLGAALLWCAPSGMNQCHDYCRDGSVAHWVGTQYGSDAHQTVMNTPSGAKRTVITRSTLRKTRPGPRTRY